MAIQGVFDQSVGKLNERAHTLGKRMDRGPFPFPFPISVSGFRFRFPFPNSVSGSAPPFSLNQVDRGHYD